ncbi:MAG: permease [Phyllobacteriaceae bacterium]|nr:permease [Phyllobacteriaceae bacterium]
MAAPGTLPWLARHELRLGWRDAMAAATGGKRSRAFGWLIGGGLVYALMFLIAWFAVRPAVQDGIVIDKPVLVTVTGTIFLFWTVTLSQALESVTRVYYTRSDLDLILSSPASPARLFAVRSAAVFLGTFMLSGLLISPLVISLTIQDGPHWLSAYLVLACFASLSVAIAIGTTRLLFRLAGPRRTRLLAQIVAGIVGAGFVIGIQAAAILSEGGFSRLALFQSPQLIAAAPDATSLLWMPARAAMGSVGEGIALAILGFCILLATIIFVAPSYARLASAAAGLNHIRSTRRASSTAFAPRSQRQTLRRKEWKLLQRDPWLLSQTLMQLLYMLPPALLLWVNYGSSGSTFIVIVPVLVMAAGQLAGGLAWLAISGEDAADLVTTAPIAPSTLLRAKVEAVLSIIIALLAPMIIALLFITPPMALAVAVCGGLAAASSTAIQLWFRVPGKRSQFRRRHTASRIATITEALSSILWAGTGALWAGNSIMAIGAALFALLVLGLARLLAPRKG